MDILIKQPIHFSFKECLFFLDRGYDECLYQVDATGVTRAVKFQEDTVLFKVEERNSDLVITMLDGDEKWKTALSEYVTNWFDINVDITSFYSLLNKDEDLRFLKRAYHGLRIISIEDLFEALCWSILGQQINLKFAYQLKRRLVEHFGTTFNYQNQTFLLFPTPAVVANLTIDQLRPLQISTRKAEYIIGVAQLMANGQLNKDTLLAMDSPQAILDRLTAIRGIGVWTANYVGMKSLKLPNSIPHGDVGLFQALQAIKGFEKRPSKEKVEAFFEPFEGWKAYLTHYLWRSLYKTLD